MVIRPYDRLSQMPRLSASVVEPANPCLQSEGLALAQTLLRRAESGRTPLDGA
jgi:hypothetical protein